MAANKTDANDADGLAHLAEVGFYREVRVKGFHSILIRTLITARRQLLKMRLQISNQIRGLMKTFGLIGDRRRHAPVPDRAAGGRRSDHDDEQHSCRRCASSSSTHSTAWTWRVGSSGWHIGATCPWCWPRRGGPAAQCHYVPQAPGRALCRLWCGPTPACVRPDQFPAANTARRSNEAAGPNSRPRLPSTAAPSPTSAAIRNSHRRRRYPRVPSSGFRTPAGARNSSREWPVCFRNGLAESDRPASTS